MKDNHPSQNENYGPAAVELMSNVSGAYSAPFWDGLLEVTQSLDAIRQIKAALEALNDCGRNTEAYHLILALYELAAIEVPTAISELAPYPEGIALFMNEFLLDIEDLMFDYEYEAQHPEEA